MTQAACLAQSTVALRPSPAMDAERGMHPKLLRPGKRLAIVRPVAQTFAVHWLCVPAHRALHWRCACCTVAPMLFQVSVGLYLDDTDEVDRVISIDRRGQQAFSDSMVLRKQG